MGPSADRQRVARESLARAAGAEDGNAIALLVEAVELDPALHEAYVALGRLYRRSGQLRAELAMWNERARLGGVDGDVAERIGWILWFTGRPAEAVPWLERAVALTPESRWNRFYLGNAHLSLRDHQAAEANYREVLQQYPDHSSAHAGLAWALLAAGRDEEARRQIATMRSSELDRDRLFVKIADLELFVGDLEGAARDARKAVAEDREARYWPRGVCATTILAAAIRRAQPAEALRALEESAAIDELRLRNKDEGPMPRYDLGAVHALRGEHDQARRWLADAIAAGWRYPDLGRRDPLLAELHEDPAFIAMLTAPP